MKHIKLYDYQLDMRRQIETAFRSHQSVMVQMPTGTGKTYLLASCVNEWIDNHEGEVWIVAHRRELVEQIRETLETALNVLDVKERVKVYSIQWLARHYLEVEEQPSMIVIDEAHHALAKTYAEVMNAFPEAKKLGVTATPCRLTQKGFTDLFEVLLTSMPISDFIKKGYLADFDYVSLSPNSDEQKIINGLEKRAADGDYNITEMQKVLDTKPTIERLFNTVGEFAEGKKGIVYAINIEHAEHIAEYYREHGVNAVAISSKTPQEVRKAIVENFRNTNCRELTTNSTMNYSEKEEEITQNSKHKIQNVTTQNPKLKTPITVLVNVDLFGEGFDCPDVEFIQLARPTLSLAKYMQMVGRGLRVAKSKECCIILDNVGVYRLFGLPNAERDWNAMFIGKLRGKGVADMARDWALRVCNYSENYQLKTDTVCNRDMVVITRHDTPSIAEQMSILLDEFGKAQNFKYERHGLLGEHTYIRISDRPGVYHFMGEERLGWKLMYDMRTSPQRYYLLNNASGQMVYAGRTNIWSRLATGVTSRYCRINKHMPDKPLPEYIYKKEYVTDVPREPFAGKQTKCKYGDRLVLMYAECGMESMSTYVCRHVGTNKYAICNNENNVILDGLENVELSDDNIAKVTFCGEKRATWVDLYTMQEFDERPIIAHRASQDFLRVGDVLYSYRDRFIAGIPLNEQDIQLHVSPMDNVEQLQQHGFALFHSRRNIDIERPWKDLVNGIRFVKQPRVETHGFLEFSTTDGMRLYPRVHTNLMDNDCFVLPEALAHGTDDGLQFRNFFIPHSTPPQIYVLKDKMDNLALFQGAGDTYYTKEGLSPTLSPISLDAWEAEKKKWQHMVDDFERRAAKRAEDGMYRHALQADINGYKLTDYSEPADIRISRNGKVYNTSRFDSRLGKWRQTGSYTEFSKQAYGMRVVRNWEGKYMLRTQFFEKFRNDDDPKFDFAELLDEAYLHIKENGREYFVDLESGMCFDNIPELVKIGCVIFQKDGDMYFPFNYRLNSHRPFRRGEITGGEDICFIGKNIVVLKDHTSIYYIRRRYTDGKRFIVSTNKHESATDTLYNLYYDGKNPVELTDNRKNLKRFFISN